MDFIRRLEPMKSMDLGKGHLIKNDIETWLNNMGITGYTINDDLTIDIKGCVDLSNKGLEIVPEYIRFREVTGWFVCYRNKLKTLEFLPPVLGDALNCSYNRLVSLEGCPQTLNSFFDCSHNRLTSLKGGPRTIKNRKGYAPGYNRPAGFYDCSYNRLTSLDYGPLNVDDNFLCNKNKIKTLKGLPAAIGGHFNCRNNELSDLKNVTLKVGKNFECYNNPVNFTAEYVKSHVKVGKKAIVVMPYRSDAHLYNK
jgi:hypothetical protein